MPATLVSSSDTEVTVPFTVRLGRSMLDNEVALQCALNEAGTLATQKVLGSLRRRWGSTSGRGPAHEGHDPLWQTGRLGVISCS